MLSNSLNQFVSKAAVSRVCGCSKDPSNGAHTGMSTSNASGSSKPEKSNSRGSAISSPVLSSVSSLVIARLFLGRPMVFFEEYWQAMRSLMQRSQPVGSPEHLSLRVPWRG